MQAIFEECETNAKTVPIVTRPNGLSKTQNVLDCIHISFIVKRFFLNLTAKRRNIYRLYIATERDGSSSYDSWGDIDDHCDLS